MLFYLYSIAVGIFLAPTVQPENRVLQRLVVRVDDDDVTKGRAPFLSRVKRDRGLLDKDELVNYHNELRRSEGAANMNELRWDDNIAKNAKNWLSKCLFNHPDYVPYTLLQNLGFGAGTLQYKNLSKDGVLSWYEEKNDFDYNSGQCSGVCGHYVAMTTWDVSKMGCAFTVCPYLYSFGRYIEQASYLNCEYYKVTQDWPDRPYIKGPPCSKCHANFSKCVNKLCTGPDKAYAAWDSSVINETSPKVSASAIWIMTFVLLIFLHL